MPPDLYDQAMGMVMSDKTPYKSMADFARDALYHRMAALRRILNDPDVDAIANALLAEAEVDWLFETHEHNKELYETYSARLDDRDLTATAREEALSRMRVVALEIEDPEWRSRFAKLLDR